MSDETHDTMHPTAADLHRQAKLAELRALAQEVAGLYDSRYLILSLLTRCPEGVAKMGHDGGRRYTTPATEVVSRDAQGRELKEWRSIDVAEIELPDASGVISCQCGRISLAEEIEAAQGKRAA